MSNLKKYPLKLSDYEQVFKHTTISKLPKKTLYMTDIICTKTILQKQEATR